MRLAVWLLFFLAALAVAARASDPYYGLADAISNITITLQFIDVAHPNQTISLLKYKTDTQISWVGALRSVYPASRVICYFQGFNDAGDLLNAGTTIGNSFSDAISSVWLFTADTVFIGDPHMSIISGVKVDAYVMSPYGTATFNLTALPLNPMTTWCRNFAGVSPVPPYTNSELFWWLSPFAAASPPDCSTSDHVLSVQWSQPSTAYMENEPLLYFTDANSAFTQMLVAPSANMSIPNPFYVQLTVRTTTETQIMYIEIEYDGNTVNAVNASYFYPPSLKNITVTPNLITRDLVIPETIQVSVDVFVPVIEASGSFLVSANRTLRWSYYTASSTGYPCNEILGPTDRPFEWADPSAPLVLSLNQQAVLDLFASVLDDRAVAAVCTLTVVVQDSSGDAGQPFYSQVAGSVNLTFANRFILPTVDLIQMKTYPKDGGYTNTSFLMSGFAIFASVDKQNNTCGELVNPVDSAFDNITVFNRYNWTPVDVVQCPSMTNSTCPPITECAAPNITVTCDVCQGPVPFEYFGPCCMNGTTGYGIFFGIHDPLSQINFTKVCDQEDFRVQFTITAYTRGGIHRVAQMTAYSSAPVSDYVLCGVGRRSVQRRDLIVPVNPTLQLLLTFTNSSAFSGFNTSIIDELNAAGNNETAIRLILQREFPGQNETFIDTLTGQLVIVGPTPTTPAPTPTPVEVPVGFRTGTIVLSVLLGVVLLGILVTLMSCYYMRPPRKSVFRSSQNHKPNEKEGTELGTMTAGGHHAMMTRRHVTVIGDKN